MKTTFMVEHENYMFTIAELIEAIEQITEAKVKKITSYDGERMTFEIVPKEPEAIQYEEPICKMCGKEWSLNEEGYCSQCWVVWNS